MKKLKPRQRALWRVPHRLAALDDILDQAMRDADRMVRYAEEFPPRKKPKRRKSKVS